MDRDAAGYKQEHYDEISTGGYNHRAGGRRDYGCWEELLWNRLRGAGMDWCR